MNMVKRVSIAIALMAALMVLVLLGAPPTQKTMALAYLAHVCDHGNERHFSQPDPQDQLPADSLLRTISSTSDAGALRTAFKGNDLNALRGHSTALTHAVTVGNWNAVLELLAAGANVNRADWSGETAVGLAISLTHLDIACQLVANGATVPAPTRQHIHLLPAAARAPCGADAVAMVRLLLESGYPVDAQLAPQQQTALHIAASGGNAELTRLLLDHSADATLSDAEGQTPLQVAQAKGHEDVVRLLSTAQGH